MFQEVIKMVYYPTFTLPSTEGTKIFKMQKRAMRIITGSKNTDSCRDLSKNLKILPFQSQYILSLLLFVADNKGMHNLNSGIPNINTRQKLNFRQHSVNLSLHQREVHSFGIKTFNISPKKKKKHNNTTTTATSTVLYTYLKVDIHPPNELLLMRNNLIQTFSLHYPVALKNKTITVNMK
jgi:hypothetical protein